MGYDRNLRQWILPALILGTASIVASRRRRNLPDRVAENLGDWTESLANLSRRARHTLGRVDAALERVDHVLRRAS
jgi:hypothetical protein